MHLLFSYYSLLLWLFLLLLSTNNNDLKVGVGAFLLSSPSSSSSSSSNQVIKKSLLLLPISNNNKKHKIFFKMKPRDVVVGRTTSSIPTLSMLLQESPPLLQSIFSFWCNVWNSSKATLMLGLTPIKNVLLYQPPVGIVTWLVTWQWIQKQFFPKNLQQNFLFLDEFIDFPLGSLSNNKQRPKSSDIDTLDRQYNTLGGVQSRALGLAALCATNTQIQQQQQQQQQQQKIILKLIDSSHCSPRESRSRCARRCVETIIQYYYEYYDQNKKNKNNKDDDDPNNVQQLTGTLLELRALDALLRCLRDDDMVIIADQLRTTRESLEVKLKTYSTSKRQWVQRVVIQKWWILIGRRRRRRNNNKKRKATSSSSSLTQLRDLYQETTINLHNGYDKLGQIQQLLLEQPTYCSSSSSTTTNNNNNNNIDDDNDDENNDNDNMDERQQKQEELFSNQCYEWNRRAKKFIQEILITLWSKVDSNTTLVSSNKGNNNNNNSEKETTTTTTTVGMDLEELKEPIWSLHHWSIALDLVEHSKLRRRSEIQQQQGGHTTTIQFWTLSEWKAIIQKLNYYGIPYAIMKIVVAKVLRKFVLVPHWPRIKSTAISILSTVWGIVEFRFYTPMKVIAIDLLNYHQRPKLLDPTQLRNEQHSLRIMLQDLGINVDDGMENISDALAEASRMYEEQLKNGAVKNMIFGKMIRLLLIQVQQLKSDLLQAFQSIDELVDANRLNVSLLAIIPAVLLVRWGTRFLYGLLYRLRVRDVTGLTTAHMELTNLLRKLEQLLILADDKEHMSCQELGEFIQQQQKYLLFLDYCQPPFPIKQVDSIYNDMQDLLPQGGGLDKGKQLQLLKLIHQKNADLLKSL